MQQVAPQQCKVKLCGLCASLLWCHLLHFPTELGNEASGTTTNWHTDHIILPYTVVVPLAAFPNSVGKCSKCHHNKLAHRSNNFTVHCCGATCCISQLSWEMQQVAP